MGGGWDGWVLVGFSGSLEKVQKKRKQGVGKMHRLIELIWTKKLDSRHHGFSRSFWKSMEMCNVESGRK